MSCAPLWLHGINSCIELSWNHAVATLSCVARRRDNIDNHSARVYGQVAVGNAYTTL